MISSKSIPAQSSMEVLGKERLFLAAGMTDSFRTELMFQQDKTRAQRQDGADPRPGDSSAGCSPGTGKSGLNSSEKDWCQVQSEHRLPH